MSEDEKHRWDVLGGTEVFRTPWYSIVKDRVVNPVGAELDYYVIHPTRLGAGVVAVDDGGRVLMVRQWRHTVQKLLWEIPAGGIDPGERPDAAAGRELREETGWEAGELRPLYEYHPTAGSSSQTFFVFEATGLKRVGASDAAEIAEVGWFTREAIEGMIDRGEVVDGMSLVALLVWLRGKRDGT